MIVIFAEARDPDIFYRCGFDSDVTCIYLEDGDFRELHVPGFECARAKRDVQGVVVKKLTNPKEILENLEGPFVIPKTFPYAYASHLQGEIETRKNIFLERAVKRVEEQSFLDEAQHITHQAITLVQERILASNIRDGNAYFAGKQLTSESLKHLARSFLIEQGYDCPDMIIASGKQTAYPHDRGSGIIKEGPVIIDIFPQSMHNHYFGDMTRTVIAGKHEKGEQLLAAVKQVCKECVLQCVPGKPMKELYLYAIEQLEKLGFATNEQQGMIHSLGHGVGLQIHEFQNLGPKSEEVLQKGMVVTIEPGLYYAVGARHEELVVVDETPKILGLDSK